MFEQAGFRAVRILARQEAPWQVIDGIEFRSVTVEAHKIGPGAEADLSPVVTATNQEPDCAGGACCCGGA